jgi:type 2 lantibiotic biosynthesis protein LanM
MTDVSVGVSAEAGPFAAAVAHLVGPALDAHAERLAALPGLAAADVGPLAESARRSLFRTTQLRLNRLLLLELHAAKLAQRLTADTSEGRWEQFAGYAATPEFWHETARTYPALLPRLRRSVESRLSAHLTMARRLAADRPALATLVGAEPGALVEVAGDRGDSHRGGQTVAVLRFTGGSVVYKPRSLAVDAALAHLLDALQADVPRPDRIRVPPVLGRDGYGWAAYVEHRYCADEAEETRFYRAMGEWLAVMQLVAGGDLHAENVVACETLFFPEPPVPPTPLGDAFDRAAAMVRRTALRTGLLPWRQSRLAMHGVDISAVGALPGQQPRIPIPVIEGAGTDGARLVLQHVEVEPPRNHPTPVPHPERFWDDVVAGYHAMAARIDRLDARGELQRHLARFAGCELRVVPRATQAYVEIVRMLWHPASLHDEAMAVAKAREVLAKHSANSPGAPSTPDGIAAEVDELLAGDVPVFTFAPEQGRVVGPGGIVTGTYGDQLSAALAAWRATDARFEESVIRASLVGAYLNQGLYVAFNRLPAEAADLADLDRRRRELAADLVRRLCAAAVWGDDGTVTWIGPVLTNAGWMVRALTPDLYSGQAGLVVCLSAYAHEARRGAVPNLPEVESVLAAALATLQREEDAIGYQAVGGYTGIAAGVWTWLFLHRLTGDASFLRRATALVDGIPPALARDRLFELLTGAAGVIVPMLCLAERTGDRGYLEVATAAAHHLEAGAAVTDGVARWPSAVFPGGIGGFAHGCTGIGWALARLGLATGEQRWLDLADGAFAFEETLWRPERGLWEDARVTEERQYLTAWCHGSTGIGLSAWDLYRRTGRLDLLDVARRGGHAGLRAGFNNSHTMCHGDLGTWELVDGMAAAGALDTDVDRRRVVAQIVTSMERQGPVEGLSRGAFTPSLLAGVAGMAYQLMRTEPSCELPSVLLLDA